MQFTSVRRVPELARAAQQRAQRWLVWGCLGAAAFMPAAHAGVSTGVATTLTSTADRMISYRHQEHLWQTADGAVHVMINRGKQTTGDALGLYSSFDGGTTWTLQATLPKTDAYSVSDGALSGTLLNMVYGSSAGEVRFAQFSYNTSTHIWSVVTTQRVPVSSTSVTGINPSLVIDRNGNAWAAYVEVNSTTGASVIVLSRRASGATTWTNTGLTFGPKDNLSAYPAVKRSARLLLTPGGIGMVYTVREQYFWAERPTAGVATKAWTQLASPLYTSPYPPDTEPMSSHFSTVVDNKGYIHMAFADGGNLLYQRYDATALAWGTAKQLTTGLSSTYPQVAWLGAGQIAIAVNVDSNARVYQASDRGASPQNFVCTDRLMHPVATTGVDYGYPRIEIPSAPVKGFPVPVLQQYIDGSLQRALHYQFASSTAAGCQ
jgi:hypothetical protein